MNGKDWQDWHRSYDVPGSTLARRLSAVQDRIRIALDSFAPGPVRVVSMCAGEGRDLLEVLASHPRSVDVDAWLVELDPGNAARASASGLPGVSVFVGDAARTDNYVGHVPADLVLMCGVFGNVTDADIHATVTAAPQFCAPGGLVVWTRHRRPPDLVPQVCQWYEEAGFELVWVSDPSLDFGVGVHRFVGTPAPLVPGVRLFTFVGRCGRRDDVGAGQRGADRLRAAERDVAGRVAGEDRQAVLRVGAQPGEVLGGDCTGGLGELVAVVVDVVCDHA